MMNDKEFLPEEKIEGRRGFYPVTNKEWQELPLPLRCSTWDAEVQSVVFDAWFNNYSIRADVHVHPENVFKVLFSQTGDGTQLYSVCSVVLKTKNHGTFETMAKWYQDTKTGAFAITDLYGQVYGKQGGYMGHIPASCYMDDKGQWMMRNAQNDDGTINRCCLV